MRGNDHRVVAGARCRVAALTLLFVLAGAGLDAAEPALGSIQPFGFQRGREWDVQFNGARLGDVEQLLFYSPGITVQQVTAANDNQFTARLKVADDCRPGIHAVRVRTATGISNLMMFSVGVLPDVEEVEPNNEFGQPQSIPWDCTVNGVVQNEDVDYFVIEAKKGERITAELEGIRLGYTFFDPSLAILNAARFELVTSDDAPLLRQDALCSILAPEDGRYIVQVRESAYGGDGNCKYRLHVGRFPRPRAVIPAGGKPGETLTLRYLGDPAGEWTGTVTLPSDAGGTGEFGHFASDAQGLSPSPNTLRVTPLDNVLEVEPNDAPAAATPAVAPGAYNGMIGQPNDVDYFRFEAQQGQVFDIRVLSRTTLRSPLDSVLTVHNADGGQLAGNDDNGMPDSYLRFTAPASGAFLVAVRDHLGAGGPNYAYRVEVAPVQPELIMSLPERVQYLPVTLSVPRGNRMALLVAATRNNFGGDVALQFDGLPAGMTAQTVPLAAGLSFVPVVFSAAADAATAGTLTDVVGKPTDPNLPIVGHLRQRTMLVRGQNNIDVWGHDAERMATAITKEAPFQVEIVQPKVPLVRDGAMQLKVVARRAEGFNEAISVQLLYAPPGVGASGAVAIAAGQSEALIPLTANGGAQLGTWPLVAIAAANTGNGTIEVASPLIDLVVADSFFTFTFEKAAVEQGQATDVLVRVEKKREVPGPARLELLGLPANTTTETVGQILPETTEVAFRVQVAKEARPGIFKSLVVRATLLQQGEPIEQTVGTGELRIDEPLPPKVQPAPMPAAPAAPPPPQPEAPKRLSRLEQLRLEKQQSPGKGQ